MSVLIKGMVMPRACQVCPLSHWNKLDQLTGCELTRRYVPKDDEDFWNNDRPSWCPLIPVPSHGDLIDRDALPQNRVEWEDVLDAPAIIPAEAET